MDEDVVADPDSINMWSTRDFAATENAEVAISARAEEEISELMMQINKNF